MKHMPFVANPERLDQFKRAVRKDYDDTSIIREIADYRKAAPDELGNFVRIGLRFYAKPDIFIEEYAKPDTYVLPEILGLGRSIAIGEQKYFMSEIEKSFTTKKVDDMIEMARCLEGVPDLDLTAAFVPIAYFMDLHFPENPICRVSYEDARYLIIGDKKARVFWSNNYVEFNKFYFIGKRSVQWIVKPDSTGHWVRVTVNPDVQSQKFDVTTETVARLEVVDKRFGLALLLSKPPRKEFVKSTPRVPNAK